MSTLVPPPMVKRAEWGAAPTEVTKKYEIKDLPIYLIYCSLKSHLKPCKTKEECCNVLKEAQTKFKQEEMGDIPYSFIISEDGTIYEGRGWEYKPQKAIQMEPKDFDPRAYDIAYFGDWSEKGVELPSAPFKSTIDLLLYGVKRKYVFEEFDLEPFRQDKFVPKFYPGTEYFEKNAKPIKIKQPVEVKEGKCPEDRSEDDFMQGAKGLTIAESFAPHLIPAHWPLASIPLWAGLLEGVLLPIVLAMTDKAFVRRVATIYSRRRPSDMTKPPQGMHGKFRPFNNCLLETQRPMETVRFPITNGSLFTSLDGRIPIIHNYRRTKGVRTTGPLPSYHVNQRYRPPTPPPPTIPDTPHMSGGQLRSNIIVADINCDRKTESPLSPFTEAPVHKTKEQVQCYTQRLSTSELRDPTLPSFPQNIQQLRETLFLENQDSEDSYEEFEETCEEPIYATLSSRSACSATTAANDDFEFYQQETPRELKSQLSGFKNSSMRRRVSRSSSIDRILSRQESDEETEISHPRPMYRPQRPPPRRSRLSRRPGPPPTPPPPRRLAPVLSVDSLVAALHQADVSYLDTGDLYRHGSVPDLKKVFYTGFL